MASLASRCRPRTPTQPDPRGAGGRLRTGRSTRDTRRANGSARPSRQTCPPLTRGRLRRTSRRTASHRAACGGLGSPRGRRRSRPARRRLARARRPGSSPRSTSRRSRSSTCSSPPQQTTSCAPPRPTGGRVVVKLGCALQGRCPRAVFMDEWDWDLTMSAGRRCGSRAFARSRRSS